MDFFSPQTRAHYRPSADFLNISMDFNAAPSGTARGTEVVIPDNASPQVRAAAEAYNRQVAEFAARNGITDYPVRGVRTRSENGRGVPHTIHAEPFFNSDIAMQEAIKKNPAEFAAIYQSAFGGLPNARAIAPHGVGKDRGAASSIFGDETSFGELIANTALGNDYTAPEITALSGGGSNDTLRGGLSLTPDRMGAPPILDMMEAPQMEPQKATGILGRLFGDMTEERADDIRLGVNGMLHNPNRGLERKVQGRMDDRRQASRDQRAQQSAAQQANKTAAWLATQPGGEQFAQAIASGALPAGQGLQMWQAQSKGPEQTALVQQYNLARSQGYAGSFMDYQTDLKKAGASNSNVTVNNSDGNPMLGTIPQGYEAVKDPETGAFTMRPVPGGPEDNTAKEALADEGKRRSGDVVIEDIDRVISKMDDGGLPVAGMGGGILSNIPGTDAHDASKLINTIKANVGFDRLQQMRDSSPTGGALGAINQSEMTLLNSALGSLEQSQSPEQFKENLTRLKGIYAGIVHGAGGSETTPEAATTTAPDFSTMSDEELDAYIESGGR